MIHSPTRQGVANSATVALRVLADMGFWVNLEKSALTPTQILPFLSIEWDTLNVALSLAPDNALRTHHCVRRAYFFHTFSRHQCECLLDCLFRSSGLPTGAPEAPTDATIPGWCPQRSNAFHALSFIWKRYTAVGGNGRLRRGVGHPVELGEPGVVRGV